MLLLTLALCGIMGVSGCQSPAKALLGKWELPSSPLYYMEFRDDGHMVWRNEDGQHTESYQVLDAHHVKVGSKKSYFDVEGSNLTFDDSHWIRSAR